MPYQVNKKNLLERIAELVNEKKVEGSMTAQFQRICEQIHDLGLSGLYFGIEAKLLQTVLYNAFLMMTYERLRTIIKILLLKAFILSN